MLILNHSQPISHLALLCSYLLDLKGLSTKLFDIYTDVFPKAFADDTRNRSNKFFNFKKGIYKKYIIYAKRNLKFTDLTKVNCSKAVI